MAHINGMMFMMNSLSANIASCNANIMDLNKRVHDIQATKPATIIAPAPEATPTPRPTAADIVKEVVPLLKADMDALRAKVAALEGVVARERALIESTVLAKAEEFVRRIVRERVATESDAITARIRAHVDEYLERERDLQRDLQRDLERDADAISLTASEAPSKAGARKRAGPAKSLKNQGTINVE